MNAISHPGSPTPLGATVTGERTNFAVYSSTAKNLTLCLFFTSFEKPDTEIPLTGPHEGIWHVAIDHLPPHTAYAFRIDGGTIISDPYAHSYANLFKWADFDVERLPQIGEVRRASDFDWQGIGSPQVPLVDLVIYEMHVRGFTIHPSSQVKHPGTYAGIIEKIPYLKKLGVNAVELMPIYEFDETTPPKVYSATKLHKVNYWGYHPISFFIPMSRYAADPVNAIAEFKTMVRELHRNRIEVILDVVYNHTGESDEHLVSMRALDKTDYYLINEQGYDLNYSGCGNTLQNNHPVAERLILDSLRYWVQEMKVDGFRFDLAAILTRAPSGAPLSHPPILEAIANDPILRDVQLIAEPWDAAGLSQVGQFHRWGKWSEWNGSFRDHVRGFIKGTENEAGFFAMSLCGSEPTYPNGNPQSGVNFITAHDGFSLRDLVTYDHKHNIDNGENNRDGANDNRSWNCGAEGPTQDIKIHDLRERQLRNFWLALLLAQGVPMILMGDEIGHTRKGNNNPYVQDNDINWFDWQVLEHNRPMMEFVSSLIAFRQKTPAFHKDHFLRDNEIEWHGHLPHRPDWKVHSRFVACTLQGPRPLYIAFNADFRPALAFLPTNHTWHQLINTKDSWDKHYLNTPERAPVVSESLEMAPHSAVLLIS